MEGDSAFIVILFVSHLGFANMVFAQLFSIYKYPSIHFLYSLSCLEAQGAWSIFQLSSCRRWATPRTPYQSKGHVDASSYTVTSYSSVRLDNGRELQHSERNQKNKKTKKKNVAVIVQRQKTKQNKINKLS